MEAICPRQWLFSETSQAWQALPNPALEAPAPHRPPAWAEREAKLEGFRKTAIRRRAAPS
jgi:hypothetical protein